MVLLCCGEGRDVPVSDQVQRSDSRLLRVPSNITANQRQERDEWRRRRLSEVVAGQTPAVVSKRQADN